MDDLDYQNMHRLDGPNEDAVRRLNAMYRELLLEERRERNEARRKRKQAEQNRNTVQG